MSTKWCPRSSVCGLYWAQGTGPITTQTFSIGLPDSSTMYPSSRQSPGSGVGLERGAAGGFTATDAAMPTKFVGRGAAVPTGVDRTRAGVAEGSTVGDEVVVGI